MPKLRESPAQRMERVFRAAVKYGLERNGEKMADLAKEAPKSKDTVYRRMRNPGLCPMSEMLYYAPKFFNDRQLCEMFGVEYNGNTKE